MRLFDCHAHTSDLSYCCAPGITEATYLAALARGADLTGIAITNHGFAIYSPTREEAFAAEYMRDPALFDRHLAFGNRRLEEHLRRIEGCRAQGLCTGLEVELLPDGRLTFDPCFRGRLDVLIGSVHFLPHLEEPGLHPVAILSKWWEHTEALMCSGIDILGHPFRWLHRNAGLPVTDELLRHLVEKARRFGVALEINAHMVIPADLELLKACVAAGVPVAVGSDSHAVEEIGNLDYQRKLIQASGIPAAEIPLWLPKRLRGG
ncbi:MAG: PHP domain-containing protein [Lentisphaeria bacterium]|jgi:histidinol phosphatase-like PHP family hydrolase